MAAQRPPLRGRAASVPEAQGVGLTAAAAAVGSQRRPSGLYSPAANISELRCGGPVIGAFQESKYAQESVDLDRKSTRLNSSHQIISYAVFCLKKKKNTKSTYVDR